DNILGIDKTQSPDMMDVIVRFDGSLEKRYGSNTQNAVIIANSAAAGFNPAGTLTGSLQAFWRFNEPSGTRYDSWGSHILSDINSVGADGGILNRAALFVSANTQFLMTANTNTLAGSSNFAISSWIYLNSTSNTVQQTIVSKRDFGFNQDIVLLLHFEGADGSTTFTDNSLNTKTVVAAGDAQIDTAQFKFGAASGLFDGTGDELTVTDHADFDFGTGDFTIEFFARFNSLSGVQGFCYQNGSETGWIEFYLNDADFESRVQGSATMEFPHGGLNTAQWYEVSLCRKSSNVRCFLDGAQLGIAVSDTSTVSLGSDLKIARAFNTPSRFNGNLDEFMVSNVGKYGSNYVPRTTAFTNPSNPSNYEYWLFVNTDNILTFKLSSSGTAENITVSA
ncbi:MAG: LamG-like jellyroll fold domain-containing protein, partial [Nanoarchaeota archaeon]|nr:LamG-like jellyroll fold domain-containing protein [Nanoarchaeota archaeon]